LPAPGPTPPAWPRLLWSSLLAGTISAFVTLSYSIGYGALVFSGPELAPQAGFGLHAALVGACAIALVVALGSSLPFAIGGPDSNATAVLAVMAAALTASSKLTGESLARHVWLLVCLSGLLTGLVVWLLGRLHWGRLVRFVPYPVVGGFLAGTGYLILAGAFRVLTNRTMDWNLLRHPPEFIGAAWFPALLAAVALLLVRRWVRHYLVMPAVLAASVLVFYLCLAAGGMGLAEARAQGLLFEPLGAVPLEPPFTSLPSAIEWTALLGQWRNWLALAFVTVLTILLNSTGLELATGHDVDFDRELRVNGAANLVSGALGGLTGYVSLSRSLLNFQAGATARWAGVWTAALCLGACFLFTPVLAFVPRPVLAGLLLYLACDLFREWVWSAAFKLPRLEYALSLAILCLIAFQGIVVGVAVGLVVAMMLFAISYGRASPIRHAFSCATLRSNKERSLEEAALLREHGHRARAFCLQGYLFFGTSSAVVEKCREAMEREGARCVLLDFRMAQGLDASATLSFTKLEQLCARSKTQLLFSGLRAEAEAVLRQTRFLPRPAVTECPDLDRGLEWMEEFILTEAWGAAQTISERPGRIPSVTRLEANWKRMFGEHFTPEALAALTSCLETVELREGQALFEQGDPGDALFFIERGRLSVLLRLEEGLVKRLRTFGPGTVVGEMAVYSRQPRSAACVAEESCRVRRLTAGKLDWLAAQHPQAAVQFHAFVVRLLAARLAAANEELRALL
jgi:SulP family sulfate permease